MKIYLILFASLLSFQIAYGQIKKNAAYAELGGNAGLYSVNYERLTAVGEKVRFAPRVGFSWLGKNRVAIPVEANVLLGKTAVSKDFAELGLGTTLLNTKSHGIANFGIADDSSNQPDKALRMLFVLRAGYRHQKPEGGFMYRIGFTLLANPHASIEKILPFGGVSLGHSF